MVKPFAAAKALGKTEVFQMGYINSQSDLRSTTLRTDVRDARESFGIPIVKEMLNW